MALVVCAGGDMALMRMVAAGLGPLEPEPYLQSAASPKMLDRDGRLLYAFMNEDEQWSFPVAWDRISPHLINATLAVEDKRFYRHAGVDLRAVTRAAWTNLTAGRVISGASTLTMQLIKQHDPAPRTLRGKFMEACAALRLERSVDKALILEAYLNMAPYGGNVVGAEAAARRYFGKSAAELTLPEAALLAGLPKSPTALHPLHRPERARQRRDHVLRRMYAEGMISAEALSNASAHSPGAAWHDYPALAPHLAMMYQAAIRASGELQLSLDGTLQERLEALLPRYLKQYDNQVTNAALIVLDARKGQVLARVGSAAFFDDAIQGQVDLCRAPRAPGSALKPFIYGLAMEKQCLYPAEALYDNTLDYGFYNPANFDGGYNGLVSAAEALRWSLNIPAVLVMERTGMDAGVAFLRQLGLDTLDRRPEDYGLGLVLGNCEVSLESLANAYLALARLGAYQPAQLRLDAPPPAPRRVLSESVALAVWHMLEQPFPNEAWTNLVRIGDRTTRVCWKTGTSTGYHDAWAFAYNRHYVVGAWLGNNDSRPSPRLVGAHAALPLVGRVFRSLPVPPSPARPSTDMRMHDIELCAASGLPKSPWCPAIITGQLPSAQYLHRRCDVHRPNDQGTYTAHWPAGTRAWDLARVHVPDTTTRPPVVSTVQPVQRRTLSILSPASNATYVLTGESGQDRIRLTANNDAQHLHWYHNGRYLGTSERMQPLYLPLTAGEHQVTCMDEAGQTAVAAFDVESG